MRRTRQRLTAQVEADLLAEIRKIADEEGRQLQSVVEEAFRTYLEGRRGKKPRRHFMAHYEGSHDSFASLYKRLAK